MRLVALAEIFDEEVERVVNVLEGQPGFDHIPLLRMVEEVATTVGIYDGDRATSLFVIDGIRSILPADLTQYQVELEAFVSSQHERIAFLVEQHGPSSDTAGQWENILVGQPEAIVILDRLANARHTFEQAWNDACLPLDSLTPFKLLLGIGDG